jgi:phosphoribosylaminoimidazole (AIR) synthetase
MGIGMVVFAAPEDLARISRTWAEMGQRWYAIGNVRAGDRRVVIEPQPTAISS